MLGGIGAKGAKKDFKQTKKNIKRKRKNQQIELAAIQEKEEENKREKERERLIATQILKNTSTPIKTENKIKLPKTTILPKKCAANSLKVENNLEQEEKIENPFSLEKKVEPMNEVIEAVQENVQRSSIGIDTIIDIKPTLPNDKRDEKQQKEDFLEMKVINELEQLLKENRYQLKKLYTELDIIQKEQDGLYQVVEVKDKITEIEHLLERFHQIKKELEIMDKNQHLELLYQLEDPYLNHLIEKYKNEVTTQEMTNFKKEEVYTSLMSKIIEFEKTQEQLSKELMEKKKELELRDIDMQTLEDRYLNIEFIAKDLEKLANDAMKQLKEIEYKVNEAVSVTSKMQLQAHYTMGILTRSLLLFSIMKMNPKPKANVATAAQVLVTANLINHMFNGKRKYKKIKTYHYTDYHNLISNSLKDTDSTFTLIYNSIQEVHELKDTMQKEFSPYIDVIPEYQKLLDSMEKIESELLEREDNMKYVEQELKDKLKKNDQKVYHYQQLNQE